MAEPIDDGPEEEFSGVFTDIFPAEWAADPDFCQYLTQLRDVFRKKSRTFRLISGGRLRSIDLSIDSCPEIFGGFQTSFVKNIIYEF